MTDGGPTLMEDARWFLRYFSCVAVAVGIAGAVMREPVVLIGGAGVLAIAVGQYVAYWLVDRSMQRTYERQRTDQT